MCNKIFGLLKQKKISQRKMQVVHSSKIAILCHGIPINKMSKLTVKNRTLVRHLVL